MNTMMKIMIALFVALLGYYLYLTMGGGEAKVMEDDAGNKAAAETHVAAKSSREEQLIKRIQVLERELAASKDELNLVRGELSKMRTELDSAAATASKQAEALAEKDGVINAMEAKLSSTGSTLTEREELISKARKYTQSQTKYINTLKNKIREKDSTIGKLHVQAKEREAIIRRLRTSGQKSSASSGSRTRSSSSDIIRIGK